MLGLDTYIWIDNCHKPTLKLRFRQAKVSVIIKEVGIICGCSRLSRKGSIQKKYKDFKVSIHYCFYLKLRLDLMCESFRTEKSHKERLLIHLLRLSRMRAAAYIQSMNAVQYDTRRVTQFKMVICSIV